MAWGQGLPSPGHPGGRAAWPPSKKGYLLLLECHEAAVLQIALLLLGKGEINVNAKSLCPMSLPRFKARCLASPEKKTALIGRGLASG